MELKDIIGKRLKEIRENAGLSQGELAKEMSVTQAAVAQYEVGRNCPSHNVIAWYADKFGVTIDFIYGRTEYPYPENSDITKDDNYNKMYKVALQVFKDIKEGKVK